MNQLPILPLAKSALDRDSLVRTDPNLLTELAQNSATRVLSVHDSLVRLNGNPTVEGPMLLLEPVELVPLSEIEVYLGKTLQTTTDFDGGELPAGTPVLLRVLSEDQANQLAGDWHNLRRSAAGLSELDAGLWTQALAIANWHLTHQFCPRCGSKTHPEQAGWSRRCPVDDRQVFPRTDPAIIVAVTDEEDRLLLGSQGSWEQNRWSVLAGFVEAGESLNAAVAREVFEESGIKVDDIEYLGSQPWPFPYSLMFGFKATARAGQTLQPDGEEIVKLRWVSRAELAAELDELLLPGRLSIARALIENWFGRPLEGSSR
ncbi:MAG: NAD(+) diphosphatase [Actinomycetales bacterium]|nr:NAD(+) diphosphatase [Actinomycetales bacterium]